VADTWTIQDEISSVYWMAYEQGRRDAQADLERWAEEFIASAPGAAVMPLAERHAAVVGALAARAALGNASDPRIGSVPRHLRLIQGGGEST